MPIRSKMLMSARVRRAWIHSRMKLKKMNRKTRKISTATSATPIRIMFCWLMPCPCSWRRPWPGRANGASGSQVTSAVPSVWMTSGYLSSPRSRSSKSSAGFSGGIGGGGSQRWPGRCFAPAARRVRCRSHRQAGPSARTITFPPFASTQRTHTPALSMTPSVMASTRLPSNSTVPDGRIGDTVFPIRFLSVSSSEAPATTPGAMASSGRTDPIDMRRHAETATNPTAGKPDRQSGDGDHGFGRRAPPRMIPTPSAKNNKAGHHQDTARREKDLRDEHDGPDGEHDQGESQVIHDWIQTASVRAA